MKALTKVFVFILLVAPLYGFAASYTPLVGDAPYATGGDIENVGSFIQAILTWSIGLASVAAVAMIIVNGFKYVAGAGNTGETKKAREGIRNAVLGLILLIASVFILNFINPTLTRLDVALTPINTGEYMITSDATYVLYTTENFKETLPTELERSRELQQSSDYRARHCGEPVGNNLMNSGKIVGNPSSAKIRDLESNPNTVSGRLEDSNFVTDLNKKRRDCENEWMEEGAGEERATKCLLTKRGLGQYYEYCSFVER